eukprot:7818296-Pyramimonas_sp.AAC.2
MAKNGQNGKTVHARSHAPFYFKVSVHKHPFSQLTARAVLSLMSRTAQMFEKKYDSAVLHPNTLNEDYNVMPSRFSPRSRRLDERPHGHTSSQTPALSCS